MNAKLTKGLAAAAVSAAMMLGAAVPALAADAQATYTDQGTVNITKSYELEGQGVSPEETFTVTQDGAGTVSDSDATTAPALTNISTVTFAKGAAGSDNKTQDFAVTLPEYSKVGIYSYNLKETVGNTAGVTYRTDYIKLVVTVIEQNGLVRVAAVHCENEGGKKTSSFADNKYSAGELDVKKTVEGNLGDKKKEFKFTVTFNAPADKSWTRDITVDGGASDLKWDGNTATFTLSDGDTAKFKNVPAGVTYTVDEDDYSSAKYETKGEVTTPTAMTSKGATVTVTNTKNGTVDTGVLLNNAPYIAIIGGAAVVAIYAVNKRRHSDMD
jgi:pilin isopeptide linkage protein